MRRFESKGFTWSVVELIHCKVDLVLTDGAEVTRLRKILAQQAVGVLIRTAFPCSIGPGEVEFRVQSGSDFTMPGELAAII